MITVCTQAKHSNDCCTLRCFFVKVSLFNFKRFPLPKHVNSVLNPLKTESEEKTKNLDSEESEAEPSMNSKSRSSLRRSCRDRQVS